MLSLPLHEGASNNTLARIWTECVVPVKDAFSPEFIILQCGVDGLAGDPCSIWNLGLDVNLAGSLGWVVQNVMDWDKRTLLLGGGITRLYLWHQLTFLKMNANHRRV